jgi:hypothetical protein
VIAVVAALIIVLVPGSDGRRVRSADESIFQDDQLLLYSPAATVRGTLDTLRKLGVDRVRVTVLWAAIAPAANARREPRHFSATDPAAYPRAAWVPYDRIISLAAARGIGVDFNVTAPGPLWAMVHPAPSARVASHYRPSPAKFGQFVAALGRRYSGSYAPPPRRAKPLPRVSYWTIWNEPNQPGWLAPQWRTVGRIRVLDAPRLYRLYVDQAFAALEATGHRPSTDTILIGELAPEGIEAVTNESPIAPIPFLRAMYCVDASYHPLAGPQVAALHCPAGGSPSAFVKAHPGLFDATGFAHHPYSFFLAPNVSMSDANFVPLADLSRLEGALDRIFAAYGVHRQLPIYVTEYGYETNPPNPFRGVSLRKQALYLNEAQYLAWKDPRVRSTAQFLLVDSAPDRHFRRGSFRYWSTFQTGLEFQRSARKPSFGAYMLPIYIPDPAFRRGRSLFVWGMLRAAPNDTVQHATIQWRPLRGHYITIASVSTGDPSGFLTTAVHPPGSGTIRIGWMSAAGKLIWSRAAQVLQVG